MGGKKTISGKRCERQKVIREIREQLGLEPYIAFRISALGKECIRYQDFYENMSHKGTVSYHERKALAIKKIEDNYGDNIEEFWLDVVEDIRTILNKEAETRHPLINSIFDCDGNVVGFVSSNRAADRNPDDA